jgi:hypothetical protein
MQPGPPPSIQVPRIDGRSVTAASLCVMALFFDGFGWLLAIAGIVMLRRAVFDRSAKLLLAAVAILPKILFIGVRSLNAPAGLSFPIEPRNLATSPALWAWSIFMAAFGIYLIFMPQQSAQGPDAPIEPPRRSILLVGFGLALIAGGAALLLGLTDGFHRIDGAGQGRWALRHAALGNVAVFSGSELGLIDVSERHQTRGGSSYDVGVALADGRSFSVSTKNSGALEELRRFATTANLPEGKVRILRSNGERWINGASGVTLKDCAGRYELADDKTRTRSTLEFWLDGDRLNGKETVTDPGGRHVRVLRNIKVNDRGDVEFQSAPYVEASQAEKAGTLRLSFRWSPDSETGRFVKNGFETGLQKYTKQ